MVPKYGLRFWLFSEVRLFNGRFSIEDERVCDGLVDVRLVPELDEGLANLFKFESKPDPDPELELLFLDIATHLFF